MKSRNTPRGGNKNEQRELLEQAEEDQPRHCHNGSSCLLGRRSQGGDGCVCGCDICMGYPTEEEERIADALGAEYIGTIKSKSGYFGALNAAAVKTGFDNWLAQQMKNPEFKRVYEEMIEGLRVEDEEDNDD
jgi:hypothetical protein